MTFVEPQLQTHKLADGRLIAYSMIGDPAGHPVLYCHGFYGSRLEALLAEDAAKSHQFCILAINRPGIGDSDDMPGRTLPDWPDDVSSLLDYLHIDRLPVLGVSGGAPYALACAERLAARVTRVALVGGLSPLQDAGLVRQLPVSYRAAILAWRMAPFLVRLGNRRLARMAASRPGQLLQHTSGRCCPADREVLQQEATRSILCQSLQEAARQGALYGEQELTIYGSSWGVDLSGVTQPVSLWHGDSDTIVPPVMAGWLHQALPHSSLHELPGEGHFSLPVRHAEHVLLSLRE